MPQQSSWWSKSVKKNTALKSIMRNAITNGIPRNPDPPDQPNTTHVQGNDENAAKENVNPNVQGRQQRLHEVERDANLEPPRGPRPGQENTHVQEQGIATHVNHAPKSHDEALGNPNVIRGIMDMVDDDDEIEDYAEQNKDEGANCLDIATDVNALNIRPGLSLVPDAVPLCSIQNFDEIIPGPDNLRENRQAKDQATNVVGANWGPSDGNPQEIEQAAVDEGDHNLLEEMEDRPIDESIKGLINQLDVVGMKSLAMKVQQTEQNRFSQKYLNFFSSIDTAINAAGPSANIPGNSSKNSQDSCTTLERNLQAIQRFEQECQGLLDPEFRPLTVDDKEPDEQFKPMFEKYKKSKRQVNSPAPSNANSTSGHESDEEVDFGREVVTEYSEKPKELTEAQVVAKKQIEDVYNKEIADLMIHLGANRSGIFFQSLRLDKVLPFAKKEIRNIRLKILDATAAMMGETGGEAKTDLDAIVKALKIRLPILIPGFVFPKEYKYIMPNFKRKEQIRVIIKVFLVMIEFYSDLFYTLIKTIEESQKPRAHLMEEDLSKEEMEEMDELMAYINAMRQQAGNFMEVVNTLEERSSDFKFPRYLREYYMSFMTPHYLCQKEEKCFWKSKPGGLMDCHPFQTDENGFVKLFITLPLLENSYIRQTFKVCPSEWFCPNCYTWKGRVPRVVCRRAAESADDFLIEYNCVLCKVTVKGAKSVWTHIRTVRHIRAAKIKIKVDMAIEGKKVDEVNFAGRQDCLEKVKKRPRVFRCVLCDLIFPKNEKYVHMNSDEHLAAIVTRFLENTSTMGNTQIRDSGFDSDRYCEHSPPKFEIEIEYHEIRH